jgi:hypothetical protein
MSIIYPDYVTQLANLLVISSADTNFNTQLPGIIAYAENRIYREVDFVRTQTTDSTTLSSGIRDFAPPTNIGYFITIDNINVITPAGTLSSAGTRVPLVPTAREFIDTAFPSGQTVTGIPEYYALASDTDILLGPPPDKPYVVEVIGEQRPAALSSANSSTYLTQYVPDLMIIASMVYCTAYLKNFGAQSDDPKSGTSWEAQYQIAVKSVQTEQWRAGFKGPGWTSWGPASITTPSRV